MLDVYIDESQFTVNGNPVLLYGIAIAKNLDESINELIAIKSRYNLGKEVEIKWTLKHPDPKVKAEVKQEILYSLATGFQCMLNITKGDDKDVAFINVLNQVFLFAQNQGQQYLNINYDAGAFKKPEKIKREIDAWDGLHCTALARHDSKYSIGIQYADILSGTFRYILDIAFNGTPKIIKEYDEGFDDYVEFSLDEKFQLILRGSIWGAMPDVNFDVEDYDSTIHLKECYGKGIIVNGDFTDEEIAIFKDRSQFYMGCLH